MSSFKYWVLAARPKTLVAALVPVYLAAVLSSLLLGTVDYFFAILAAVCTVLVQVATNFFNDAIDFTKGADTQDRLGPIRMVQAGRLKARTVLIVGFVLCLIALILSLPIVEEFGMIILVIASSAFLFSYCYTGGPYPLAYNALGELFVYLFFGVVAVMGAYFIQGGAFGFDSFVLGSQVGLYACVLISINNLRDIEQDKVAQKKTLAVLLGVGASKKVLVSVIFAPLFLGSYWFYRGYSLLFLIPLLLVPLSLNLSRAVYKAEPSRRYNQFLAKSALQMILFSLLFSISVCLEKY